MDWAVIINIISNIAIGLFVVYSWNVFLNCKINFKNYKTYIAIFVLTICGVLCSMFLPNHFRILVSAIILCTLNYCLFCKEISKSIVMVIVTDITLLFAELISSLILLIGNISVIDDEPTIYSLMLVSFSIPLFAFLILKTQLPTKAYNYLTKTFYNMKNSNLMFYFIATIILISLFLIMSYIELPPILILTCNSFLTVIYIIIIAKFANIKENYRQVYSKYETSLSNLKESETIIDQHRIDNHENKNQLLIIRNMVKANAKNTVKYIDTLIDNKINDNENIFYKTSKIPEGGLRFTIYSKLCKMKDMGIEYSLEIANEVSAADLINMDDNTMLNICKIIGVFLDNAIEAVEGLNEKDIIVEIFVMDNNLCIEISNNYKDVINLDKISNTGYSTKGKGHGYGLSLVSELVKKDSNLENEKEISKDLFTQRLKIKM